MSKCETNPAHNSVNYCKTCATCHECLAEQAAEIAEHVAGMMSDWTLDFIERNPITTQEHLKEQAAEIARLRVLSLAVVEETGVARKHYGGTLSLKAVMAIDHLKAEIELVKEDS
jgi:hypothetical protein